MPELSRFFGLLIKMQYLDHPPPHFHVWYGGKKVATVRISDGQVIKGRLPRSQLAMIITWTDFHRQELLDAWDASAKGRAPSKIAPLKK